MHHTTTLARARRALVRLGIACMVAATIAGCLATPTVAQLSRAAPEAASATAHRDLATARRYMVSAANPLAVEAGLEMLAAGGSAVDAAIAVQLVLNLVEPQSSGLGGGAFLLHWDAAARRIVAYDGRETAPATATPDRFLADGQPMRFADAVHSGLSVGVPGLARLLEHAHRRHGKRPWTDLFAPAIRLAEQGFPVSGRLNFLLAHYGPDFFFPAARGYFFDHNLKPWPVGHRLVNPAFAATLRAIRDGGADAFYTGAIADQIVAAVQNAPARPGDLTREDLAGYRVVEREPVCATYRNHRICGMGPPSSGATTVAQTLALIEPFEIGKAPREAMNARALHLIAEAQKLAYADRNLYIGDPDLVDVPVAGLLDPGYLGDRRALIDPNKAMTTASPGVPPGARRAAFGRDATIESVGTSHVSIVDAAGNAVSMTTTIEAAFGSRLMAAGLLLNNEMTDFSFRPVDRAGRPVANAIAPAKRPRSSMAPTIVVGPDGDFHAALGSPGGSRIILYVTKALVALIDWKLDAQAAAALANFGSRGGPFELELDSGLATGNPLAFWSRTPTIWYALRVKPFGHRIHADLLTSGLHIIVRRRDGILEGGADPRREGRAKGL